MAHPTYNVIMDLINASFPIGRLNILDYGCGDGFFLSVMPESRICHYDGYDINPNSIETAKKKYTNNARFNFYRISEYDLPAFENLKDIDVIILIGVLQYMSEREVINLLCHANSILRKGGILVASCAVAHWIYKSIDLYRLFSPHRYINRDKLISQIEQSGLSIAYQKEAGICISPIFSGTIFLFFDFLDKIIFRKSGSLGPISKGIRVITNPLFKAEYLLQVDFGSTLFIKAVKDS